MSGGLHLRKDSIEWVERFHELKGDDPNQSQDSACEMQKKREITGKQKSKNNSYGCSI